MSLDAASHQEVHSADAALIVELNRLLSEVNELNCRLDQIRLAFREALNGAMRQQHETCS